MSANNLPTNLASVEKILQRLAAAERGQQKEIRITIQEARDLAIELALLTSKMGQTINEMHQALTQIRESNTEFNVQVDGGGFGQR